jgi:crotonobetainyl-CoA:carnitine CoA-transferase CaiB-like acyl-CoA transferase
MADRVASRPAADWLAALAQVGVPAGIVRSVPEALAEVDASPLTGVAPNAPGIVRLPPPMLDEHGELVRKHGWQAFTHRAKMSPASARAGGD